MLFQRKKANEVTDERAMEQVRLLLDDWQAPEPSPWFDARMMARFREEQARAPEGLFARLRDQWMFSRQATMKPLMVGAMAVLVMAGGGSYWQLSHLHASQPALSATVQDLQVLDSNDQTLQQMGQLLDDNDDDPPQS